mmetsp:Transcript_30537/g.68474  ORF Transcript_30537/g.68474 Transcript_30537/m.68474 type:complete len:273 (-) Transcript_30537:318-1136(-)
MVSPTARGPPAIYDGWFNGQIEKDMMASVRAAKAAGIKNIEVSVFPVPNVDELKFGTPLNQRFGKKIAKDLGLASTEAKSGVDVIVTRYLGEMANHYWATVVAGSPVLGGGTRHIISCDAVKKDKAKKPGSTRVVYLNTAIKEPELIKPSDTTILVGPGGTTQWLKAVELAKGGTVIGLNGSFNEQYKLGGPLTDNKTGPTFEPAYYLKRVSKGYAFRAYPGGWQAWIELPDYTLKCLKDYGDGERFEARVFHPPNPDNRNHLNMALSVSKH